MLDTENLHRLSSIDSSPMVRETPYNARIRNSNVASSQIENDLDGLLAGKKKVIRINEDTLPQISPLRNFDPRKDISSISNLKEELFKNFQYK